MLERYKTLYCVIVMAAGVILAARAGFIGWLAAVLILSFALPAWRAVVEAAQIVGARYGVQKGVRAYRQYLQQDHHQTSAIYQAYEDGEIEYQK